jgi:hypothetical protein
MADRKLDALNGLLGRTTLSASEVVHLLVEIRNLIDGLKDRSRYPVLRFFCDWTVHRQLDRNVAAREILAEFANVAETTMQRRKVLPATMNRLSPILSLNRLRDEMTLILAEHRLDNTLCCRLARWGQFVSTYVDLISRTPLVMPPTRGVRAAIDTICVAKGHSPKTPPPRSYEKFMFSIDWSLRMGEVEIAGISNDVWFPLGSPKHETIAVLKAVRQDGKLRRLPLEAKKPFD